MINMVTEYKGYKIEGDGTYGLKHIKPISRGTVPKPLRGGFTGYREAKEAIDSYEATHKKGTKDGKANDEG